MRNVEKEKDREENERFHCRQAQRETRGRSRQGERGRSAPHRLAEAGLQPMTLAEKLRWCCSFSSNIFKSLVDSNQIYLASSVRTMTAGSFFLEDNSQTHATRRERCQEFLENAWQAQSSRTFTEITAVLSECTSQTNAGSSSVSLLWKST